MAKVQTLFRQSGPSANVALDFSDFASGASYVTLYPYAQQDGLGSNKTYHLSNVQAYGAKDTLRQDDGEKEFKTTRFLKAVKLEGDAIVDWSGFSAAGGNWRCSGSLVIEDVSGADRLITMFKAGEVAGGAGINFVSSTTFKLSGSVVKAGEILKAVLDLTTSDSSDDAIHLDPAGERSQPSKTKISIPFRTI